LLSFLQMPAPCCTLSAPLQIVQTLYQNAGHPLSSEHSFGVPEHFKQAFADPSALNKVWRVVAVRAGPETQISCNRQICAPKDRCNHGVYPITTYQSLQVPTLGKDGHINPHEGSLVRFRGMVSKSAICDS